MYLLVIVTLIIGVLSLYAQILSLQAARFAQSQTGLANTMLTWHDAAVSMGANIVDYPPAGLINAPCRLSTPISPYMTLPLCNPPNGSGDANGVVVDASYTFGTLVNPKAPGGTEPVHLPASYAIKQYQFYSVLYQDSSTAKYYVVTYLTAPVLSASNPAPGYLTMQPQGNLISTTSDDLMHQLSLSGVPDYAYGTEGTYAGSPALLSPSAGTGQTSFHYIFPSTLGMNTGSIAIVSSTAGM